MCLYIQLGFLTEKLIFEVVNRFLNMINRLFFHFVHIVEQTFFFAFGGVPLIIFLILVGGIFCTPRMGFINIQGFKHAVDLILPSVCMMALKRT